MRLPSREPLLPEGSCVGGRRPLLHLVVLHASEPGVSQYARDLAIKWNWHGFDVFINVSTACRDGSHAVRVSYGPNHLSLV